MDAGDVELRLHGASGSSPELLLGCPTVVQVAGDQVGRFFRPADGNGAPLPAREGHVLEGYHWGLFTSGSWLQGLWLLLLPFGLVNLASHALPRSARRRLRAAALGALRLLGLSLTATFTAGVVQVLVDLLARQGPGDARRGALLLALAGVGAVLGVVAVLGRGRVAAAPPGTRSPEEAEDAPPTVLADPDFYRGDPDVPVLRRLHVAVGLAVVAVPGGALLGATAVPVALLGAAGLLVLLLGDPRVPAPRFRRPPDDGARVLLGLLATGLALVAGAALVVLWGLVLVRLPAGLRGGGPLPGSAGLTGSLVVVGSACLAVVLGAVVVAAARDRRLYGGATPAPFAPLAGGLSSWVLAVLAGTLGVGFTAGLLCVTRWAVGGEVPDLHRAVAAGWGVASVLLAAAGSLLVLRRSSVVRRLRARAAAAYRVLPLSDTVVDQLGRRAAGAMWLAALRRYAAPVLLALAVLGAVATAAVLAGLAGVPLPAPRRLVGVLVAVGTGALGLFALALVAAGRGAVRSAAVRRGVNVLWDVVAFWPREVHPVVPPPYAQRAVADVTDRVVWLLTTGGAGRVVLSGHSQGSLLCVAAVAHLPRELRERVALITHGSQLQLAFPRVFPAAVPVALLRWVLRSLDGRWRNLFRDTDPFGGAVLSWARTPEEAGRPWSSDRLTAAGTERDEDGVDARGTRRCGADWRLLDPAVVDPQRRPWPGLRAHADHSADPAWPDALTDVWQ
jgi:hypothetical protein